MKARPSDSENIRDAITQCFVKGTSSAQLTLELPCCRRSTRRKGCERCPLSPLISYLDITMGPRALVTTQSFSASYYVAIAFQQLGPLALGRLTSANRMTKSIVILKDHLIWPS